MFYKKYRKKEIINKLLDSIQLLSDTIRYDTIPLQYQKSTIDQINMTDSIVLLITVSKTQLTFQIDISYTFFYLYIYLYNVYINK